jgi:hypothetical protein
VKAHLIVRGDSLAQPETGGADVPYTIIGGC